MRKGIHNFIYGVLSACVCISKILNQYVICATLCLISWLQIDSDGIS